MPLNYGIRLNIKLHS